MPLESLLIGLAVVVAILALVPAGRRLIGTALDVVDGSVAMFAIRRAFGLDTTTARQRRIDRRHAREQAEILRRIGGTQSDGPPPVPLPTAPTRLVVSGDPAGAAPRTAQPARRAFLRDGLIAAVGFGVVLIAVTTVLDQPTGGVLGATSAPNQPAPSEPAPVIRAPVSPSPVPSVAATATDPIATPAPTPTADTAAGRTPVVGDLTASLTGSTGGGRTVTVRLAWDLADGSAPASRFDIFVQVDEREPSRVRSVDGDARSVQATLGVGRTSTFRIVATGDDGTAAEPVAWAPIQPGRHQETSSLVSKGGSWRPAAGPSLSGGGVTFSRSAGSTLTFRFRGTDVAWIATRTPMSGRAEVRADGEVLDTIDLAADSVRYRQLVFRRHLAGEGTHVLEIRALGDGRVDVDAFVVLR